MQSEISAESMRDVYNFVKANWEYQLLFGIMGLTALIGLAVLVRNWLRVRGLAALAAAEGMNFAPGYVYNFSVRKLGLPALAAGDRAIVMNLLAGAPALPGAAYFDFFTSTGRKGGQDVFSGKAVALYAGAGAVPDFELAPEGALDRAVDAVTGKDIDLPGSPGFSGRYRLRGADREKVAAFFTPELAGAFESLSGNWRVQAARGNVMMFRKGLMSAGGYPLFLEESRRIFTAILNNLKK